MNSGAVTSPTILPPSSRAVSLGIGPPGPCRSDIQIPHNLPGAENDCSLFFEKEKHTPESCAHLEDCEAEAEAAASAVAVAAALSGMGFPVGIKWPNDVLATSEQFWRRKLCGIRSEMELAGADLAWVSLGIGINVNHEQFPDELAKTAGSLRQLNDGNMVSRAAVAAAVLDKIEDVYVCMESSGFAPVRERWLKLAMGIGQEATVRDDGAPDPHGETTGIVRGMDEDGHLLMEVAGQDQLHAVYAGDLIFEV